jgi:hypothetical protein
MRMGKTVPRVLINALSSRLAKSWDPAWASRARAGTARADSAVVLLANEPLARRAVINSVLKILDAIDVVVIVDVSIVEA